MRFVIEGAPRTKKNHQRIMRRRDGSPFVAQAETATAWEESAVVQLLVQRRRGVAGRPNFMGPVTMCALIYRDRAGRADLLNYLAAVSDALERAGVVEDDSQVASVDGSRLLIDRERPRVEVEVTAL